MDWSFSRIFATGWVSVIVVFLVTGGGIAGAFLPWSASQLLTVGSERSSISLSTFSVGGGSAKAVLFNGRTAANATMQNASAKYGSFKRRETLEFMFLPLFATRTLLPVVTSTPIDRNGVICEGARRTACLSENRRKTHQNTADFARKTDVLRAFPPRFAPILVAATRLAGP